MCGLKMTDNIYSEMCRTSPVQKEFKNKDMCKHPYYCPKHGYNIVHGSHTYECPALRNILNDLDTRHSHWDGDKSVFDDKGERVYQDEKCYDKWIYLLSQEDWQEIYESSGLYMYTWCPSNLLYIDIPISVREGLSFKELFTMRWCLFVSREVYNLTWNWEKKKWKPVL
jgi:hypothetical protein